MRRIVFILFSLCALVASSALYAQSYPNRPLRMIVGYPPGGGLDLFTRTVGAKMAEGLGQPIVVENRPGASTIIATEATVKSPPDGYTVLVGDTATLAVNPLLYKKLPYDPFKDLAPVTLALRAALLLTVHPSVPTNTVREFIDHVKANPGKLNYASPGPGSPHHLAMEMFKQMAGVNVTHVAYKGGGPAMQDYLPGQVQAMFLDLGSAGPHVRNGKIRALAVGNATRIDAMKDLPTVAESGVPGYDAFGWGAIVVPAGTPRDIVMRLNLEYAKAMGDAGVREKLNGIGFDLIGSTPEGLAEHMRRENEKWGKVVREGGLSLD